MTDMSVRGAILAHASRVMNVAPQTDLMSATEVRKALQRNLMGHNYGVYCEVSGDKYRVYAVRSRKGVLQVRVSSGWKQPERIFKEG
jgi:hypothetical protein